MAILFDGAGGPPAVQQPCSFAYRRRPACSPQQLTSALSLVFLLTLPMVGLAYPPATPHEVYGSVRGEDGEPITDTAVQMILETDAGIVVSGAIAPGYKPGIDYYITVPMDADIAADPYLDNALTPTVPFLIKVVDGGYTNLPLEMTGSYSNLGQVGESTRIDLTMGVDSDGDGLPDAWEQLLIFIKGNGLTLYDIDMDTDTDGDGMTDGDEYIAGTYAFEDQDVFALTPVGSTTNGLALTFLGIQGRSYEIQCTTNLTAGTWDKVDFKVPSLGDYQLDYYYADETGVVLLEVSSTNDAASYRGLVR